MKKLFRAIPHLTIVLGLMTLTFFTIDRVNRAMAFMTSELSKWVFAALAVLAIASAVSLIANRWREDARRAKARKEAAEEEAFYTQLRAAQGAKPDEPATHAPEGASASEPEQAPDEPHR